MRRTPMILAVCVGCGCASAPSSELDRLTDEEADVLGAVVDYLRVEGDFANGVVAERSVLGGGIADEYPATTVLPSQRFPVETEWLAALVSANERAGRIRLPEGISIPCRMAADAELAEFEAIEDALIDAAIRRDVDDALRAKAAAVPPRLRLSRPGWSRAGRALVYFAVTRGAMEGWDGLVELTKADGQWKVDRMTMIGFA